MNRRRAFWLTFPIATFALMAGISAYAGKTKPVPLPGPGGPTDCRFVLCAYPDCLPTEHTEIPAGQCCPVCVPN